MSGAASAFPGSRLTRLAVAVTAAYALGAAATTPFTVAADVVTAVPLAVFVTAVVVWWPLRPFSDRDGVAGRHPYRAWVVLVAVVVAWELVEYLAPGSRGAHPTLSSMLDAVDRTYALKALVFFAWIWLGILVVRSGRAEPKAESQA